MGDRCSMNVYCRKVDEKAIDEALGGHDIRDESDDGMVVLEFDDVNYGGGISDGDHGDIPFGIPCYGYHGTGSDYGPGEFCTDGLVMLYEEMSRGEREHVIGFDTATGEPNKEDIKRVQSYLEHWRKVYEMVHGRPFGPVKPPTPEEMAKKWMVWGPDGLPIQPDPFDTREQAEAGKLEFLNRYEQQGYYSSVYGRIELFNLPGRVKVLPFGVNPDACFDVQLDWERRNGEKGELMIRFAWSLWGAPGYQDTTCEAIDKPDCFTQDEWDSVHEVISMSIKEGDASRTIEMEDDDDELGYTYSADEDAIGIAEKAAWRSGDDDDDE